MSSTSISEALDRAEAAVSEGRGLSGTGFWPAVSELKKSPDLVEEYADRTAEIDRKAFRSWALLVVPFGVGTTLAVLATLVGVGLVGWAYALSEGAAVVVFFVGTAILLGSTHGLGHLVVGRALGIRFTNWFVGEVTQPQPGVKIDYASYLRTPARSRAWMHAAGALTTKAIPFLLIGAAVAAGLPDWVWIVLVVAGLGMVATDIIWSTTNSDWKKFRREMDLAQES